MPCRQNIQRRVMIGIGFKSAGRTFEFSLRWSVCSVYASAMTACLAGILRRNDNHLSTQPFQLVLKLPSKGRFNIKFCGRCVPVCNQAETVTITDGTTTYSTVLTRCGNSLTLGALAYQIQRFCVAHFCGSSVSAGTAILQDKLLCCPTIYTPPTTAAAAAVVAETANPSANSSSKKA